MLIPRGILECRMAGFVYSRESYDFLQPMHNKSSLHKISRGLDTLGIKPLKRGENLFSVSLIYSNRRLDLMPCACFSTSICLTCRPQISKGGEVNRNKARPRSRDESSCIQLPRTYIFPDLISSVVSAVLAGHKDEINLY